MKKPLLLLLALGSGVLFAAPPAWWSEEPTRIFPPAPTPTPNNLGPVNQGQLKNVARKASLYLDTVLEGGSGEEVEMMVEGFGNDPGTAFAPVNLGQLKAVAKPFYDRLIEAGFDTRLSLQQHGAPSWAFDYPWDESTPKSVNLAPASIGQLKWVFSFDLDAFDSDGDGIPDAWELKHFGDLSLTGDEDSDGDGLSNGEEYAAQTDPNSGIPVYPMPTLPAAPSHVTRTVNPNGSVTVTWQDNSNNEDVFNIYELDAQGNHVLVGTVPAGQTSFTYTP